ncbi:MAG TPA: substrate-binding domain-containing protein [Bacteroidota bacterium]|nr:substrate-binding domain-containing protein [Bacteroidota bacterium]
MRTASFHSFCSLLFLTVLLSWTGCQKDAGDLPTRGKLVMISSEDIYPAIDSEVKEFESMYEQAHITHLESTTRDAVVQLLNDSVKLVTSPRPLNEDELAVIKKYKLEVDTFRIAYEAALVLVNEKNSLEHLTVDALREIMLGKKTMWRELGERNVGGKVIVALGDPNSGMYEYILKRVTGGEPFANVIYPCSTTTQTIAFVAEHRNAIGFVSQSWVAETPAKTKILAIGDPAFTRDSTSKTLEYFPPLQAHVYRDYYPLRRTLYIFSKNAGTGVAVGFTAFVTGSQGQKLFLNNGLVPATMPVRLIQLQSQ